MRRKIKTFYERRHGRNGALYLTLTCGHRQHRKASQGVPAYANCSACDRVKAGGGGESFDTEAKTRHWQTWDEKTGLPVNQSAPMTAAEIECWIR